MSMSQTIQRKNCVRVRSWPSLIVLSLFAGSFECALFGEDFIYSVRKLNDSKPWDPLVGSTIRVEGRMSGSSGVRFKLLKCDAWFIVDDARLKSVAAKSTVEIKGRFKKEGSKPPDFIVEDLKVVPSYLEQFESKASRLKRPTTDEWIELGNWASERAQFYEDSDLGKKASDAYTNAIELEYKSLKVNDAVGRFALAKKLDEYKLSKRRRFELIHEGLRIEWQALQKSEPADPSDWQRFAKNLGDQLSGTNEPLKTLAPDLKDSYEQDPISTYRKSKDETRLQLHRLFFVAITRKILLHKISDDGHDGDSIAEKIDELIPEEHALAEKHRLLRLSYRLANVGTATRIQVENLATILRDRHRNDEAKQALQQWIKAHEPRLKEDGVVGRLQLADEYLTLLNDEQAAVEHLKDAYKIEPSFEDVKTKLQSLGYQWRNGRWIKEEMVRRETPAWDPNSSATSTGIQLGLTASDLRARLGQPRSLARAITSRGITEVWSYSPAGTTPLVIRLEKKGRDNEPKVTSFAGE